MIIAWAYLAFLSIWIVLQKIFRDRFWWLGLMNSLSFYWLLPTLFLLPYAIFVRHLYLIAFSCFALAIMMIRHGKYLLPRHQPIHANGDAKCLRIMTYNLLQSNGCIPEIIKVILNSKADIIFFQEMNQKVEDGLKGNLSSHYPYQVYGMKTEPTKIARNSIFSKYPLNQLDSIIRGTWASLPQICRLMFQDRMIHVINIHAYPHKIGTANLSQIANSHQLREITNREIIAYIDKINDPLIIAGDFNTTDQNYAYQIMRTRLIDVWREIGWGLGHSFGLRRDTFSNRKLPTFILNLLPKWLVRIDFVFHSKEWTATKAKMGQWDGLSDHRPIIVDLVLKDAKTMP
jgi:endonuclease/exonuclease/phosphatase (EEP) superfamily protein YafD